MKINGKITKADDDRHLVFGWASVSATEDEEIVDAQDDSIPIEELERAAYEFVEFNREGGEMHEVTGVARLIESMVFTPEKKNLLGIDGVLSGWWVGFKVTDDDVWQKIKSGEYSMFSIGGSAKRSDSDDETN